ncbi:MAG: hypothetical protein HND52_16085 [Ignavibacteriae bacterium]|nr:hypothetical protein [Ignavibacteriota bacterium]NOG99476.1 hypothetical protein [Ignavibacteriota bacterium]
MNKQKLNDENVFSFTHHKNKKVIIFWRGKQVKILKDKNAIKFLNRINTADEIAAQLIMAKATGNFKRGNERE